MTPSYKAILLLITNLGDSGLLTVLAFLASLYLYLVKSHRAALALTSALLSCLVVMTLLKIGFRSCHRLVPTLDIVSPSGHAAMAAAIIGTLAVIFASTFKGWRKNLALLFAFGLIGTIAASRVILGAHTINEVLMGITIGLTITLGAFLFLKGAPQVPFKARYLAATSSVAVILLYGSRTPAEDFLISLVQTLKLSFHFCAA